MSNWLIAVFVFLGAIVVASIVFFALTLKDFWAGRSRSRRSGTS
jgi:hypothetical protein